MPEQPPRCATAAAGIRRLIEAGAGGFCFHGLGRLLHGEKHADLGIFAVYDAPQIPHMRNAGLACLDRENNLLGAVVRVIMEEQPAVNALVSAFLFISWPRAHQAQGPELELI